MLLSAVSRMNALLKTSKNIKKNKEAKKSSKLANLRPVLLDGTLRVGGRLQEAAVLSWDENTQ